MRWVLLLFLTSSWPCLATTNCATSLTALLHAATCGNFTSIKDWSASSLSSCNSTALRSIQQTLSVNFYTMGSDAQFAAALQRWNKSRPAGAWPVQIGSQGLPPSLPNNASLPTSWDVYITQGACVGDVFSRLAAIRSELLANRSTGQVNKDWLQVEATLEAQTAIYGVQRSAVALGGASSFLYYRHDILRRAGVSPNMLNTWGGVLQAAALLHGKDWDGDGQTEYGFCFNRALECAMGMLYSLMAPITQTQGSNQGTFINADTEQLLVGHPSVVLAAMLYQKLMKLAPITEAYTCTNSYNQMFLKGRCAIAYTTKAMDFKAFSQLNASRVRGKFSVLPMPGSDIVLNQTGTARLVPCDDLTCPLANLEQHPASNSHSYDPTTAYVPQVNYTQLLGLDQKARDMLGLRRGEELRGGSRLNRAPVFIYSVVGVISGDLPEEGRRQAMRLLTDLGSGSLSWSLMLDTTTDLAPYLYQHFELGPDGQLPRPWLDVGYDPGAVASYLDSIRRHAGWGLNNVASMQFPGAMQLWITALPLTAQINAGTIQPDALAKVFNDTFYTVASSVHGNWTAFMKSYKYSLSYQDIPRQTAPQTTAPSLQPPPTDLGSPSLHLLAVLLGILVPLGLLAVAAAVLARRHFARTHHDLWGRIVAPPCGPETTLLVAQLQDREDLLQALAPEMITRVLDMYGDLVDKILMGCMGYKMPSSTLGCLRAVFHNAKDAAGFALRLHDQLLAVKWPKEVTDDPSFEPIYMLPRPQHTRPVTGSGREASLTGPDPQSLDDQSPPLPSLSAPAGSHPLQPGSPRDGLHTEGTFGHQCTLAWQVVPRGGRAPATTGVAKTASMRSLKSFRNSQPLLEPQASQGTRVLSSVTVQMNNRPPSATEDTFGGNQGIDNSDHGLLMSQGLQVCIALCATCTSELVRHKDPSTGRMVYSGQALDIAESTAAAGQGGMTLIPQWTFRLLPVEVMAQGTLFCHWGEYQFTRELMALDVYLALDKTRLGLLSMYRPLTPGPEGRTVSPGVLAAPVERAAMVFSHIVGVQALMAWNYEETVAALEVFTRLAQRQLKLLDGYLVEHVSGFVLSAFKEPGTAILWAMHLQALMMRERWSDRLLSHELCEEVLFDSADEQAAQTTGVSRAAVLVHRGPRLKAGVDEGPILAALNTVTGRMAYRGKVMNRAARIASTAACGQVLCSAEALIAARGAQGLNTLQARLLEATVAAARGASVYRRHSATGSSPVATALGWPCAGASRPAAATATQGSITPNSPCRLSPVETLDSDSLNLGHTRSLELEHVKIHADHISATDCTRTTTNSSRHTCTGGRPSARGVLCGQLCAGTVQVVSLGLSQLKGVAEPVEVHLCSWEHHSVQVLQGRLSSNSSGQGPQVPVPDFEIKPRSQG